MLVATATLVTLAGMAAADGSLLSVRPTRWQPPFLRVRPTRVPGPTPGSYGPVTPQPRPVAGAGEGGLGHWVSLAVVVVAVVLLAVALVYVAARLLRSSVWRVFAPARVGTAQIPPPDGRDATALARVAAHVDAAVEDLAEEHDPRAAVIGCWLRLERAAADVGIDRARSETSAELAHRVLSSYDVDARDVVRLNELYRAARYGRLPVGDREREAARSALLAVRRGLGFARAEVAP